MSAFFTPLHAQPHTPTTTQPFQIETQLSAGYGSGQVDWNIGEISGTPDVLSELNYHLKNVWIGRAETEITLMKGPLQGLFLAVSGQWGLIESGRSTDRDWNQSNRQQLFSLSHSDTTGDNTQQLEVGLGYHAHPKAFITLSPQVGYSYREQNIRVENGVQEIATKPANLGEFKNKLDSTYFTQWEGVYAGINAKLSCWSKQSFSLNAQFHKVHYDARANWNLRPDFKHPVSFRHAAEDGDGLSISSSWEYRFNEKLSTVLSAQYQKFNANSGIDRLFFSNETVAISPLNNAHWESTQLMLGIGYRF